MSGSYLGSQARRALKASLEEEVGQVCPNPKATRTGNKVAVDGDDWCRRSFGGLDASHRLKNTPPTRST